MNDIIKEYQNQNIDLGSSVNIEAKLSESKQKLDVENNHENKETTNDKENNKKEDNEPEFFRLISSVISPRDDDINFDDFEREKEANERGNCCKICNIM